MSGDDLTRRAVLGLVAGAGAGALSGVGAGGAIAKRVDGRAGSSGLASIVLGTVDPGVRTVKADRRFELVGLQWAGPARPRIEVRTLLGDGSWGKWASAGATGHAAEGGEVARAGDRFAQVGEPVWVGGSEVLQVRTAQTVVGLTVHLVAVGGRGAETAWSAGALPLAQPVLNAGPGQPPIIARRAWAGRDSPPRVAPEYGDVELGFVHHTLNPNGYSASEVPAMLRAIYLFHRDVNGWNDIGYNFVIDLFGRVFEARAGGIDEPVTGAQAGGYNAVSSGVAVLGDFEDVRISASARRALQSLLAWKLSLHGVPVNGEVEVRVNPAGAVYSRYPANAKVMLPRIAGHRDADATDCPGNALYHELRSMRGVCRRLAGEPGSLTIELTAPSEAVAPSLPAPEGAEQMALSGRLTQLGGAPIADAPIEVQARAVSSRGQVVTETTLARLTTDAEGSWSVPVAVLRPQQLHPQYRGHGRQRKPLPEPVSPLRALCPGGNGMPVVVSPPLQVEGEVSVNA